MELDASLSWLALSLTPGLASRLSARLLREFGSPEEIFRASLPRLESCNLPGPVAQAVFKKQSFKRAEKELALTRRVDGCRLVNWSEPEYGGTMPADVWGFHAYRIDWYAPPMTNATLRRRTRTGAAAMSGIARAIASPSNPDCFLRIAPAPKAPAATSRRSRRISRQRIPQATAAAAGTAAASSEFIVNPSMCGPTPTTANTSAAAAPVAGPRSIHPITPSRTVSVTPASPGSPR